MAPYRDGTTHIWASIAKCSPDTAPRDISDLLSRGILCRSEAGGAIKRGVPAVVLTVKSVGVFKNFNSAGNLLGSGTIECE